jgi:hypothetical protein
MEWTKVREADKQEKRNLKEVEDSLMEVSMA